MSRRIVIFGGSFNPPGRHHTQIVNALAERFDEVILLPCGPRPDKRPTAEIDPVHRATMVDLAFGNQPKVRLELFDLEQATFTPTHEFEERFEHLGELWYAVGSELVKGGATGESAIQSSWFRGPEIWEQRRFFVLIRPGYELAPGDLPPHSEVLDIGLGGSSSVVRERAFRSESISELVEPRIAAYIERYALFEGGLPLRTTQLILGEFRPLVITDEGNPKALELAKQFTPHPPERANMIVAIGGDGTMLHALREHWRLRLPILGLNAGHRGFLLNDPIDWADCNFAGQELIVQHLPLLYAEATLEDGNVCHALAFNDVWVERASSQTAWIQVRVDGATRLPKLVSDGVLVSTAAGSTAYARALGATPLRADTPELLLVGSNVLSPFGWRSVHLALDSQIEFHCLDPAKRKLEAYADGVLLGNAVQLRIRKSRTAAVELVFSPQHDLTAKLTDLQFPVS